MLRLANTKSAIKRAKTSQARALRNKAIKSRLRTFIKRYKQAEQNGDLNEAESLLRLIVSQIDKAASKGVIHKKAASRRKSRLMKSFANMKNAAAQNS